MRQYLRVLSRVFGQPLLIAETKAAEIVRALEQRMKAGPVQRGAFFDDWDDAEEDKALPFEVTEAGIALITIEGTLVHQAATASPPSMLTSYRQISTMVMDAATAPNVRGILLDIDSPGGEVAGCFDCADVIRDAARIKPVWAVSDEAMFSAAYALGSAASKIYVPRTGGVGSVGVIGMWRGVYKRDAMEGLTYRTFYAGARKNDMNPHEPITKQAEAEAWDSIQKAYALFVDHVSRMRGMSAEAVRSTEAAIFEGDEAIKVGLADKLGNYDDALAAMTKSLARANNRTPTQMAVAQINAGLATLREEVTASRAATASSSSFDRLIADIESAPGYDKPEAAGAASSAQPSITDKEISMPDATAAAPAATPVATAAPPAGNVVDINAARAEGEAAAMAYVNEVNARCALAGFPAMAADFIGKKTTLAEVTTALLAKKAAGTAGSELSPHHDASGEDMRANNYNWSAIMAKAADPVGAAAKRRA